MTYEEGQKRIQFIERLLEGRLLRGEAIKKLADLRNAFSQHGVRYVMYHDKVAS